MNSIGSGYGYPYTGFTPPYGFVSPSLALGDDEDEQDNIVKSINFTM